MALFSEEEINKANEKTRVVKKEQTIKYDTQDMSGKDGQVRMIVDGEPRWVDPVGPEKVTVTEVNEEPKNQIMVPIDKDGVMGFSNQVELGSAARFAITMQLAPDHLRKNKDGSANIVGVMAALMMCKQRNLPMSAMNDMAFIKGKLQCYGKLTTAFCETHPEYGEHITYFINEKQDIICLDNKNLKDVPWACVVRARKKNQTDWREFVFSVDDAEQAGLLTKNTKPDSGWIKYLKDLLYNKVKNRFQGEFYASSLVGVNHYDFSESSYNQEPKEVGPSLAEKLESMKNEQG